jgi:hypothetical protein
VGHVSWDEQIMILIINPYYSIQIHVRFRFIASSYSTHPSTRTWPSVTPSKSATYLYYKRIPYKFIPLVQFRVPLHPGALLRFGEASASARLLPIPLRINHSHFYACLPPQYYIPVKTMSTATRQYMPPNGRLQTTNLVRNFHPQSGRFI